MSKSTLGFIAVAIAAVVAHYFIFQMRYGWYATSDSAAFLVTGYAIGLIIIISLWMFYPSRVAVAAVGLIVLGFPALLRPDIFAKPNIGFVAFAIIPVMLLIAATDLRSRGHTAS